MNIILTPSIPTSYQHHISANRNLDALTYLNMVVDEIHHSLTPSLKDTPFITITRLRAQPGQVIPQIQALTQNAPKDSNLAIAVGLNSTNPDGHYHPAHGWRILSNAQSKEPSKISTALATAALAELGYSQSEAASALKGADPSLSVEELVRYGLRAMVLK